MKKEPKPRAAFFFGILATTSVHENGTWLEPEELCYPHGGMTRKAYAMFPDGVKRLVACGIPDTYFSIPAKSVRINGETVRGYIGSDDEKGILFCPFTNNKQKKGSTEE